MFIAGEDEPETVLLVRRTSAGDHAGEWAIPGGKVEDGETAEEAAEREAGEELGVGNLPNDLTIHSQRVKDGVDYTTFTCRVPEPFEVTLNEEHDAAEWVPLAELGATRADATISKGGQVDPAEFVPEGVRVERSETVHNGEAAGFYDPAKKTIHLATHIRFGDGLRELSNPARLEAHEAGHAVDHSLVWASHDDALHALLRAAWDRLNAGERLGAAYYFSSVEEAFAEAFAFLSGPAPDARYFGTLDPTRAAEVMKEVISWVKTRVSPE